MSFRKSEQAIELSRAVPSKTTRSNGNGTAGAALVSAEILSRTALGHSKRKIARDLHIGRHRIDAILAQHQTAPLSTTRIARIIPLAYDAVEKTLTTNEWPQAGNLGMRLLERTDLAEQQGDRYTFTGDVSLTQAINMVPSRGATPAIEADLLESASVPAPALTVASEPEPAPAQRAATADAFLLERRAAVDRPCAENLPAAHEEQRKRPYMRVVAAAPFLQCHLRCGRSQTSMGELRGEQRRPMTADESIAEQRRFAEEWKRKNPALYRSGRRVAFSVPVLR